MNEWERQDRLNKDICGFSLQTLQGLNWKMKVRFSQDYHGFSLQNLKLQLGDKALESFKVILWR